MTDRRRASNVNGTDAGFGGGYLVAALVKVGGHPDATGGVERRDAYLPRRSV